VSFRFVHYSSGFADSVSFFFANFPAALVGLHVEASWTLQHSQIRALVIEPTVAAIAGVAV
jgi:hypothetical protein